MFSRPLKSIFVFIGLALVLAACAQTPPARKFPDLLYTHLPPIRLAVGSVEVRTTYRAPGKAPNVEHEFPKKPAEAAQQWVNDRLKAAGGDNRLRATISRASVIEVPLKRTTGIEGVFTTDQSERYDGELSLMLEIVSRTGRRLAMVSSRATRSRTVAEDVTLAQREDTWFRITEEMMNDLNASLEGQIRKHFSDWIR